MSFTNAPVSRLLVLGLVAGSLASSLLDLKHYLYILIDTHLWRSRQLWRLLAYQLCYTNSAEVLFAAMSFYHLKTVERMWGSRKFASFLAVAFLQTALLPPVLMALLTALLRPLTGRLVFNYVPAGPTPLVFALLAQYHAIVPHIYKYRIATSPAPPTDAPFAGLTLSDKSYRYAVAIHLALLQWPGSLVAAAVGWAVGQSWREGLLPPAVVAWRLPAWLVRGAAGRHPAAASRSAEFEGLRRRLEGEGAAAQGASSGVQQAEAEAERRRTLGQQVVDQFREVL